MNIRLFHNHPNFQSANKFYYQLHLKTFSSATRIFEVEHQTKPKTSDNGRGRHILFIWVFPKRNKVQEWKCEPFSSADDASSVEQKKSEEKAI